MLSLWQDIRYSLRTMRRAPGFAVTAALTLAVGLGLNASLFTIFNAYVLRPIAARDPQSLYQVYWTTKARPKRTFPLAEYEAIRNQSPAFSGMLAQQGFAARMQDQLALGTVVSENYFALLGVSPMLGRAIAAGDERTVVLGHGAWKRIFGGDPAVVGRKVIINSQPFDVVGVCGPEFSGLGDSPSDFFAPLTGSSLLKSAQDHWQIVGRLHPGATPERAAQALTALARHLTEREPEAQRALQGVLESRATLHPLNTRLMTMMSPLIAVFALVLVVCCANVASMLLARAIARQREIGVRLAIGASRSRLVRQLISEGLALSALASALGFAIAMAATQGAHRLVLTTVPTSLGNVVSGAPLDADRRVVIFVLAAAGAAVMLFALAPALQATSVSLVIALRGEFGHHLRSSTLRNLLVVTQIAVCLILTVLTGILVRTGESYGQIDVGYRTRGIHYPLLAGGLDRTAVNRLLQQLHREPAVQAVAAAMNPPANALKWIPVTPAGAGAPVQTFHNFVSPEYFEILGLPILQGRLFSADEARAQAAVAVISQKTASRFWANDNPLGKTIRIDSGREVVVIGVAKDVMSGVVYEGVDDTMLYLPTSFEARDSLIPLIRLRAGEVSLDSIFATALPDRAALRVSIGEVFALQVYPLRLASWVGSLLGGIALLLTASAMYGAITHAVSQRTREIGIRIALGAAPADVIRLFLIYCMRLAVIGITAGLAAALAFSVLVGKLLFMVKPFDLTAYAWGIFIVVTTGMAAAFVPIRRAATVGSMEAIRES